LFFLHAHQLIIFSEENHLVSLPWEVATCLWFIFWSYHLIDLAWCEYWGVFSSCYILTAPIYVSCTV